MNSYHPAGENIAQVKTDIYVSGEWAVFSFDMTTESGKNTYNIRIDYGMRTVFTGWGAIKNTKMLGLKFEGDKINILYKQGYREDMYYEQILSNNTEQEHLFFDNL